MCDVAVVRETFFSYVDNEVVHKADAIFMCSRHGEKSCKMTNAGSLLQSGAVQKR